MYHSFISFHTLSLNSSQSLHSHLHCLHSQSLHSQSLHSQCPGFHILVHSQCPGCHILVHSQCSRFHMVVHNPRKSVPGFHIPVHKPRKCSGLKSSLRSFLQSYHVLQSFYILQSLSFRLYGQCSCFQSNRLECYSIGSIVLLSFRLYILQSFRVHSFFQSFQSFLKNKCM